MSGTYIREIWIKGVGLKEVRKWVEDAKNGKTNAQSPIQIK